MFIGIISSFFLAKQLLQSEFLGHLALQTEQTKELGYTSANIKLNDFVGTEAIAATVLRPAGKIEIDGEYYDASSESNYIENGKSVIIVKYENMQLLVREKKI
jgi:membrane-bound serine protease (ClpP class)